MRLVAAFPGDPFPIHDQERQVERVFAARRVYYAVPCLHPDAPLWEGAGTPDQDKCHQSVDKTSEQGPFESLERQRKYDGYPSKRLLF